MFNKHLFSSLRLDWQTPKALYDALDGEFHFDPCPHVPAFDGLAVEWGTCNFVNPPYGREVGKWCEKAMSESHKGKTVVMLLPSRTDTQWWHDVVMKADEIRFIRGRLHFDGHRSGAPFPSAIVVFRGHTP